MANLQSGEGSSSRDTSGESSESTLQLNIKTLDSRICSFYVDNNIAVSAFKEKIANQIGIPVGQQRLIFRGKVLKDDHLLSEYNVENGDTLHVVERRPQPSPGTSAGEATSGQDHAAGHPRSRIGQIAHSIVLGTLNVGDSGEATVPDLSQVIGAVLNSVGLGNLAGGVQPGVLTSQGNEAGGSQVNAGGQSQSGNQPVPLQGIHVQSASYPTQTPIGAGIAVPSLNMPIPDSLNTLTEFMKQMESVLSQNDSQQNQPPTASSNPPTPELPRNSRGYPTVEALTIVLQRAQQLLRDHVVPALSHTAGRLDQERGSNDPLVRGQVQAESMHLGVAMQHLGALLLELGRTILTVRLGQSPDESLVNAGPAVYISPSGPNPIMAQPFPLQNSSLFGSSSGVAPNPVVMSTVGVGSVPRNVNIHIHTGAALPPIISTVTNRANNGEDLRVERVNGTNFVEPGQAQVPLGINVTASAVPSRPSIVSTSSDVPPGAGVSQASDSNPISSIVAEVNSQLARMLADRQNENHGRSEGSADQEQPVGCGAREDNMSRDRSDSSSSWLGGTSENLLDVTIMDDQKAQSEPSTSSQGGLHSGSNMSEHAKSHEELARCSYSNDNSDGSSGVPLGLGLGGLQPKRRGRQPRAQDNSSDGASSSNQDKKSMAVGQHVLQSLASLSTGGNVDPPCSGQASDHAGRVAGSVPTARQNADGGIDALDATSQVLGSPSLDGLLAGVSQQTGVGSPDMLRNMLQQFTQNPAMMNTVNQIAQQIDSRDLGSMFSGLDSRGQGGGIDLSRMMQQMMPIVSQALGGMSSISQPNPPLGSVISESISRRDMTPINDDPKIDLKTVVQTLEDQSSSEEIFHSLALRAMQLSTGGSEEECILNELCGQSGLAEEFMEMLHLDLAQRLQDGMGS